MKLHVFGLGCLLALTASGCSTFGAGKPHRPATYPAIDTRGAYPWSRLIGIKNDPAARCPKIPGWTERPLFQLGVRQSPCEGTTDDERRVSIEIENQMGAFCLYELGRGPRYIPQAAPLGLARLEPDAIAMTAAVQIPGKTGPLGQSIGLALESHFLQQVTGGATLPHSSPGEEASVRLAFIDSEPESKDGFTQRNQRMEHGHFLRLLGKRLAGDKVRITTQLALPITGFRPDHPEDSTRDPNGGFIGSFADLAEAIQAEVTAWLSHGPKHLVLNLSVGWDGDRFGGLSETRVCDLPPGPRAVYLALEYAARNHALIFAAAGNAQAGPHASTGPLLPAAWARGNIQESACGDTPSPLLYAVGGLQAHNLPIANARLGGMPEFAAYADHAVLTDLNGKPSSTYTGTSVATAVVSSIAARIWSGHEEQDDPGKIVEWVRASGQPVPYLADFYPAGKAPSVLRIDLCKLFKEDCPKETESPLLFPDSPPTIQFEQVTKIEEDCGGAPIFRVGAASTTRPLCPSQTLDDRWRDAWVVPQPDSDPCPSCAMGPPRSMPNGPVTSDLVLHAEISKEWLIAEEVLTAATLEAVASDGARTYYAFDVPRDYKARPQFDIALSSTAFVSPPVKAVVSWVVEAEGKTTSINSPVLIFQ